MAARFFSGLIFVTCLLGFSSEANADRGEVSLGGVISGSWQQGARALAGGRLGLAQGLAVDAGFGAGLDGGDVLGLADAGFVLAWDVLTWVPELRVGAGVRGDADELDPRLFVSGGVRRYLSLRWFANFSCGLEWQPEEWIVLLSLGVWRTWL